MIHAHIAVVTWAAGIGRYWDHPSAEYWQYLGAGSISYIFGLSLLLYLIVRPLRRDHTSVELWSAGIGQSNRCGQRLE